MILKEKNAKKDIKTEVIKRGKSVLKIDIPALLIATSSLFSPKFPNVIIEDKRTARGKASGVILTEK